MTSADDRSDPTKVAAPENKELSNNNFSGGQERLMDRQQDPS